LVFCKLQYNEWVKCIVFSLLLFLFPMVSLFSEKMDLNIIWDPNPGWTYEPVFRIGETKPLWTMEEMPEGWVVDYQEKEGDLENSIHIHLNLPSQTVLEVFLKKRSTSGAAQQWMEIDWFDFVQVEMTWDEGGRMKLSPSYGFGRLWYIGRYLSSENKFYLLDTIFPDPSVVSVAVFDAMSGQGLFQATLDVLSEGGQSLGQYSPNEQGTLIFFPDKKAASYRLERSGYLPLEGTFPSNLGQTPLRLSMPMVPPPAPESHRIVYTWGVLPQDVDGELTLLYDQEDGTPPLKVQLEPKRRRFFKNAAIFDRDGKLGFDAEVLTIDSRQIQSFELKIKSLQGDHSLGNIQYWHYFGNELLNYENNEEINQVEKIILFWPKP